MPGEHELRVFVTADDEWAIECSCGEICGVTEDADEFEAVYEPHRREVGA